EVVRLRIPADYRVGEVVVAHLVAGAAFRVHDAAPVPVHGVVDDKRPVRVGVELDATVGVVEDHVVNDLSAAPIGHVDPVIAASGGLAAAVVDAVADDVEVVGPQPAPGARVDADPGVR